MDLITPFGEVGSACQTCRAGADDGHFMAVGSRDGGDGGISGRTARHPAGSRIAVLPVGHEPLEFADGDRLALDAQDALAFALRFLRAHAAAHGRKAGIPGNYGGRRIEISAGHLLYEVGNLDVHRAARDAQGLLAMQAP